MRDDSPGHMRSAALNAHDLEEWIAGQRECNVRHCRLKDCRNRGVEMPSLLVNQAAGMVGVQAQCGIEESLVLMRARASELRMTLDTIAQAVLDRELDFLAGGIKKPTRNDVLAAAETLTKRGEPISAVRVFGQLRRVERHADVDWVTGELEGLADETPARLVRTGGTVDAPASDQLYRLTASSDDR
jgi:hypothetical protein